MTSYKKTELQTYDMYVMYIYEFWTWQRISCGLKPTKNTAHSQTCRKTPNIFPEVYIFVVTTFLGISRPREKPLWQPCLPCKGFEVLRAYRVMLRWYNVRCIPTASLCVKVYNKHSHLHLESIFAQPDVQRLRFASKNLTKSHYKEDRNGKNDAKESYLGSKQHPWDVSPSTEQLAHAQKVIANTSILQQKWQSPPKGFCFSDGVFYNFCWLSCGDLQGVPRVIHAPQLEDYLRKQLTVWPQGLKGEIALIAMVRSTSNKENVV